MTVTTLPWLDVLWFHVQSVVTVKNIHFVNILYRGFLSPPFEAVYCYICGRRRVAVARYRMIYLVLASCKGFLWGLSYSNQDKFNSLYIDWGDQWTQQVEHRKLKMTPNRAEFLRIKRHPVDVLYMFQILYCNLSELGKRVRSVINTCLCVFSDR